VTFETLFMNELFTEVIVVVAYHMRTRSGEELVNTVDMWSITTTGAKDFQSKK